MDHRCREEDLPQTLTGRLIVTPKVGSARKEGVLSGVRVGQGVESRSGPGNGFKIRSPRKAYRAGGRSKLCGERQQSEYIVNGPSLKKGRLSSSLQITNYPQLTEGQGRGRKFCGAFSKYKGAKKSESERSY